MHSSARSWRGRRQRTASCARLHFNWFHLIARPPTRSPRISTPLATRSKGARCWSAGRRKSRVIFNPAARRLDEDEARDRFDAVNPTPSPFANQRRRRPKAAVSPRPDQRANRSVPGRAGRRAATERRRPRPLGQIRAFNNRTFDVAKAVPTIVLRNEDFGRISRLVADGRTVEIEVGDRQSFVSRGHDRVQHDRRDPGNR